ncbi:TraB/GumN family protein [Massilia antarctica]|uniref:TraB/GumN family protein n=1 Tax=Massilia antarctica TaxID=2765360 RepID=UPI0006BC506F|nr:TraB/GumN family protein [Massilia sp. H27-R4]MCY0912121.1 TraB/GumN family protein [Massilia sp. H27-R4]CUI06407.1 lipoprotein, putative [Janthinobacterium sp. CG23_2]CUU30193.1 lipoprotein, putative [Janthinobacterium sp. CG23_2]
MRRPIIVVFLGLLMLALPAAWGAERGALFKISGSGHTMYLFGTMHVGLPGFYPLEPRIAGAVEDASVLALEVDLLQDPARLRAAMQAHALLDPGKPGFQDRSPAFRQRVEQALKKARIDPAAVARFKPWLVATTLTLAEYASEGYQAELAVDLKLAQMARASKVPVIELESITAQFAMFDRLGVEEQWKFLEESVDMMENGKQRAEMRQIVDAWAAADKAGLDAVAAKVESDTSVSGKFMQKILLDERNGPLADKLAALLVKQDKSVAAIGVLHLIGKNSVPALLGARGLTVERVY